MCTFTLESIYNNEPVFEDYEFTFHTGAKRAYKIARKIWTRVRLAEAQNWKCCWCGCETVEVPNKKNSATIEHITPRSKGGTDDWDNLAMACHHCNHKRGDLEAITFLVLRESMNQRKVPQYEA